MIAHLSPIEVAGGMILSDEVHARIGAAILDGTFGPGQRLRDVDLALQLGVSRTPIREALQRLERFGLVEIAVGRYTRVSTPDDRLREETGEFTAYLMGNALRIALQRCDEDQHATIVELADAVVDSAHRADALGLFEASTDMFIEVTKATGNAMFIGVIREAALAIQRNLHGWHPFLAGPISRNDGYERLRACIASRDADGAERMLRYLHGVS
ncbi:MAG: FadR family transcriptional regulator [Microbacterium sp.]|uniref:GntR family transcriptional regulator n=1 Tax=Microbacterium sp. TaxID=51671 RepID=UPI001ACF2899|nr:GntR family transcriptional regulator [Microbacterium sp.]MBN9176840.1 FadR family transcriptional regulator [Microbacterium sp.]